MGYWLFYGLSMSLLPIFTMHHFSVFIGCLLLGALGAFVDIALACNIQNLSTESNLGKNFGLFSTLANTGQALSGAFIGLLTMIASVGTSIILIGLMTTFIAFAGKLKLTNENDQ